MASDLRVGDLVAGRGQRVAGVQKLDLGEHEVEIPIFLIDGAEPGPTLVVTAGIHGAEYASIEAALQLGRTLQPAGLRGRVAVLPVVNMPAFRARSIYVNPLDGQNLNRVFPGNAGGTPSEQLAHWLYQNAIVQADNYIDLHGGDLIEALVPFSIYQQTGREEIDRRSFAMAQAFGIRYLVRSETRGSTYAAASLAGIPAMLAEAGGQGLWPAEAVNLLTRGLERVLRHLGMTAGPAPEPLPYQLLEQFIWLRSQQDGYYYPRVQVDELVSQGQDLGAVTGYQGNVLQPLVAPATGRVLFLVSSLAINKGDPLLAIGA